MEYLPDPQICKIPHLSTVRCVVALSNHQNQAISPVHSCPPPLKNGEREHD